MLFIQTACRPDYHRVRPADTLPMFRAMDAAQAQEAGDHGNAQ
jgi:hypothetical protein